MRALKIYYVIALAIFFGLDSHIALAANAESSPCPSSASQFGCFEVGLPGNKQFSKDQPIAAFLDTKTPILSMVNLAVTFLIAILVIIGVIIIVVGGYKYMTAAGNASQVKDAKEMIGAALIGIFIAFISVVILNTINPALGPQAAEPSLGPQDSSGTSGNTSGNNTSGAANNSAQLANLQSQEQAIINDEASLNSITQNGGALTPAQQAQLEDDNTKLQSILDQMKALQSQ
ncbi:MAG TPA: hypothetical protein VLG69_01530 [Candidatus Andersenbacteria bacterium]|nr:hypothetical protein [Candidatus Andersenbacteria bacterium]